MSFDLDMAKKELREAWKKGRAGEQKVLIFGEVCYKWLERARDEGKQKEFQEVCVSLKIPTKTVYQWASFYHKSQSLLKKEKRSNRSFPPDSFEVLRKIALEALKLGFYELEKKPIDPSHFHAAKTWATLKLKEKNYGDGIKSS